MINEVGIFVDPLRVYMKDKKLSATAFTRNFGDYFASIARIILIPEKKNIYSYLKLNSLFWQVMDYLNILLMKKLVMQL